jgi:hypothetical protein
MASRTEWTDLPELTQVEEILVARVHVFVEVRQVRGQQYKYKGHILNFLRDTGRVYNTLPLLPQNLDIIILLRPSNTAADPRLSRQLVRDLHVRRGVVSRWLHFLYQHHPGYSDIKISQEALDRLPQDASVVDDILIQETEPKGTPHMMLMMLMMLMTIRSLI